MSYLNNPLPRLSSAGKHTASTHRLSALVTPAGRSFVCTAQQTLTLISSDHQKGVTFTMYDIQMQPFDIASDFMFSERKNKRPFWALQWKLSNLCHTLTLFPAHIRDKQQTKMVMRSPGGELSISLFDSHIRLSGGVWGGVIAAVRRACGAVEGEMRKRKR